MLFNSPVFLFLFLPLVLLLYFATPRRAGNFVLLGSSLFFYLWSDPAFMWTLLLSVAANYAFGRVLGSAGKNKKTIFVLSIVFNLALLLFFKLEKSVAKLFLQQWHIDIIGGADPNFLPLPLGISFFTFSAIAYQVDIYRGNFEPEKSIVRFGLFLSHFAKVVAGPIERYQDMASRLGLRRVSFEDFFAGVRRFSIGLAKKVLVANALARLVEAAFGGAERTIDMPTAWLGLVCYTVQIYFDFSGYTDMALGLGRMLGFSFVENFNYPYISRSIREFWRRWHISLSSWLRDYIYIPLGGSRVPRERLYANIMLVFVICGAWHRVTWHFIIWGVWHGFFMTIERAWLKEALQRSWRPLSHIYALLVIMIGWVFFRAESLPAALHYIRMLFSFSGGTFHAFLMNQYSNHVLLALIAGIIGSMPLAALARELRDRSVSQVNAKLLRIYDAHCTVASVVSTTLLLSLSLLQLATSTFTPFLYGKF